MGYKNLRENLLPAVGRIGLIADEENSAAQHISGSAIIRKNNFQTVWIERIFHAVKFGNGVRRSAFFHPLSP